MYKLWHIPTVSPNGLLDLFSFFWLVCGHYISCIHNELIIWYLLLNRCTFHDVLRPNNLGMRLVFRGFRSLQAKDDFSTIPVAVSRGHTFLSVDWMITGQILMTLCIHHLDYLTPHPLHCCSLIFEFLYKCYLFWIIYRNCVNVGPVIAFRFQALFTSSLLQPSNSDYHLLLLTRSFAFK